MHRAETRLGIAGEVPPEQSGEGIRLDLPDDGLCDACLRTPDGGAVVRAGAPLAVRTNGFRQGIDRVGDETG